MTHHQTITSEPTTVAPSSGFTDFVICRLRYWRIQTQIALNEINTVGVALSGGLISAEDAVAMLDEAGLDFILTSGASTT